MGASGWARAPRALAVVAGALLLFFLVPLTVHAYRFPVGPDVPYYVWSTRLAGDVGLSVTDFRPGLHALLLGLSGGTGLSVVQVMGATAVALAVSAGLAAAALADRGLGRDPLRTILAGVATGAFTARLASGFLANLLFAVLFLAAVAALVGRRRPASATLAAGLLGTAGLAHGLFLAVGASVLGVAAAFRFVGGRRRDPGGAQADLRHLGAAALGGGALAAVGFLGASLGRPLSEEERVHTRDAFLQRAGLQASVGIAYAARLGEAIRAFAVPATLPLAGLGGAVLARAPRLIDPLFGSVLLAWGVVSAGGIVAALVTEEIPAGRVLNFALVLPFVAAVGAISLARWAGSLSRRLGVLLGLVLVAAILAGPFRAWNGTHPFTSDPDLAAVRAAAERAVELPSRTPLVFVIDHRGPHAGFELSRFVNVVRMGLPPERQDEVAFFVGSPEDYAERRPGAHGDPEHDGIAADAFARLGPVLEDDHAAFVLRPFNEEGWDPDAGTPVSETVRLVGDPGLSALPPGDEDVPDTSGLHPALVPFVTVGLLALLTLAGLGWVRWLAPEMEEAERWALSPAAGAAAILLAGVVIDAAGLALGTWGGGALGLALVGSAVAWRRGQDSPAELRT